MSYDSERRQLLEKMYREQSRLEAEHVPFPGKDDTVMYQMLPIRQQFKRDHVALKIKYGIPLRPDEEKYK